MTRPTRRFLLAALGAVALSAAAAAPARADLSSDILKLTDEAAAAWTESQVPGQGRFMDPLARRPLAGYGHDMLAYTLVRSGQRTGNPAVTQAGLRAFDAGLLPDPAAFNVWAAAVAHRNLPDLPAATRARLAAYVTSYDVPWHKEGVYNCTGLECYTNLVLLDGLVVLRGTRDGLAGPRVGQAASVTQALSMVNAQVPRVTDGKLTARLGDGSRLTGSVLSDPAPNPIAYHALSTWEYAQAVSEAGEANTPQSIGALREALDALSVLVAPDGDLTYYGRGQGQVWVPATTLAAAVEGAKFFAASDPTRAGRYLAVAQRALQNLQLNYRTATDETPVGHLNLVPGAGRTDKRGVDHYADMVTYNGLALFAMQAAADTAAHIPAGLPAVGLPADARSLRVSDPAATGLAVVRKGDVWMAVHKSHSHPKDLRYDFGLLAMKLRTPDGRWVDALAPRPITEGAGARKDSAGPVLSTRAGKTALPHGTSISITSRGEVVIKGGFKTGSRWVRKGVEFRYTPTAVGVKLRVRGLSARERVRLRVFTMKGSSMRQARQVVAQGVYVDLPAGASVKTRRGFHSAQVPDMDAYDISVRPRDGSLTFAWHAN